MIPPGLPFQAWTVYMSAKRRDQLVKKLLDESLLIEISVLLLFCFNFRLDCFFLKIEVLTNLIIFRASLLSLMTSLFFLANFLRLLCLIIHFWALLCLFSIGAILLFGRNKCSRSRRGLNFVENLAQETFNALLWPLSKLRFSWAALRSMPSELLFSSRISGASVWSCSWSVSDRQDSWVYILNPSQMLQLLLASSLQFLASWKQIVANSFGKPSAQTNIWPKSEYFLIIAHV